MMDELKQIKILSLKNFIIAFLPLEYKEDLQRHSSHTYQICNHLKHTINEEDMGLELERGLELFC
jgi:hypothetical protein